MSQVLHASFSDQSVSVTVLSIQHREQLDSVVYSSRFALALFFAPDVNFSFSWAARYVSDSSCIRYIAVDSRKRNAGKTHSPSVCWSSDFSLSSHLYFCPMRSTSVP